MPRTIPTTSVVALAVLVGGCARAEVPEGFAASLPPVPTTMAEPTASEVPASPIPTETTSAPTEAFTEAFTEAPTPTGASPTPTATGSASSGDRVPADVVAFLDRLEAAYRAQDTVRLRLDLPDAAGGGTMRGALDRRTDPTTVDVSTTGTTSGDVRIRVVDGITYVRGPDLAGPDTWIRSDPDDPDDPLAPTVAPAVDEFDPTGDFAGWRAGGRAIEEVGPEVVDGLDLVHHRLWVDLEAALAATGDPAPEEAAVLGTVPYDIWVDDAFRMHRVTFTAGPITTTSRFSDWGADLDVRAPDPATVISAEEFVRRSGE